jgi:EthD domain
MASRVAGLVPAGTDRDAVRAVLAGGGWFNLREDWARADSLGMLSVPAEREEAAAALCSEAWLVGTRLKWDGLGADEGTRPVPGVKQVSFLRRVAAISHEDFDEAWTAHVELARVHHPLLWRYTQNMVIRPVVPGSREIDGIAELTMRLRLDFSDRMYDSPEGQAVIATDVRRFIDLRAGWRILAREYQG